jgi:leucine dehydrogenase
MRRVEQAVVAFQALPVGANRIYDVPCHIFAPCALGGILDSPAIDRLQCRIVVGSANNQLALPHSLQLEALQKKGIVYAPDYIVNAGGIIATAAELDGDGPHRIRSRVRRIARTLEEVYRVSDADGITTAAAADGIAELALVSGD